jgi:hypothetical protein
VASCSKSKTLTFVGDGGRYQVTLQVAKG